MTTENPRSSLYWLLLLLALGTAYRAYALHISGLNLYVDEAQYWTWAQALDWGYYSKPPVIAVLIAATTALFGDGELAVKSGALLLYPFTTLVLYALALRLYNARVAFWTALTFFTIPGVAFSSLIISTDVALFLCWTVALYAFWLALQTNLWRWWLVMGAACGVGLLTKYTMGIFALSAVAYCAVTPGLRQHLKSPRPYLAGLLAAAIFAPNLYWNALHGWPTFHHTADISNLENGPALHWDELQEFLAGQAAILGPILFIALLIRTANVRGWWASERERFLALFTLPFLLVIAAQALLGRANANWAAMTYAAGTLWVVTWLLSINKRSLVIASLVLHLLLASLAYHYHALIRAAGVELAGHAKPVACWRALTGKDAAARCPDFFKRVQGWDKLGAKVRALLEAHPQALLLADERDTMSELLYYARPASTGAVMWNPEHKVGNHYELVTRMEGKGNRDFIFVSREAELPAGMAESFLALESLGDLTVPVAEGYALSYHATFFKGFMGYPMGIVKNAPEQ